jgi:GcrA cell cycle regulator
MPDGTWPIEIINEVEERSITPIWTPERIELMKSLWDEGVTTAEIGRRIGVSKNAVVGKVHRLGLVPRIIKNVPPPQRNVFDFPGPACMWPIGHPTDDDFHFCGSLPISGKPFCEYHSTKAYIHKDKRREKHIVDMETARRAAKQ